MKASLTMKLLLPWLGLSFLLPILKILPAGIDTWEYKNGRLVNVETHFHSTPTRLPIQADLDGDGIVDHILHYSGRVSILSRGKLAWESPANWDVATSRFADLNHDGQTEIVLLVWRAYQPWPVDEFLPYGGRTAGYQDLSGRSCHLILIGWKRGAFRELWAGSALARPLTAISPADLDGDGGQELAVLESDYTNPSSTSSGALAVWKWNGFGFDLLARQPGKFRNLWVIHRNQSPEILGTEY